MFNIGDLVQWRNPLDADYSYGTILNIEGGMATIMCSGYYAGITTEVPIKYIEKIKRGGKGFGGSKKYSKRSTTKIKL